MELNPVFITVSKLFLNLQNQRNITDAQRRLDIRVIYIYLHKKICVYVFVNHRMVWIGRDLKDHLFPTPLPWAGTPSTRPGCSKPIQPGLEHCQGWGIHNLSGQPVPVPHHPHGEEFLHNVQSKPTLCQLKTITPHPITTFPDKESLCILPVGPL